MNYQQLLSQAWKITRQHKYLWLFGFLASISLGQGGQGFNNSFIQGGAWLFQETPDFFRATTTVAVALFIISLLLWFVGVISRIVLIHEVTALSDRRGKPLGEIKRLFQSSVAFLGPILLMQLLLWLPILVLTFVYNEATQAVSDAILADIEAGITTPGFRSFSGVTYLGLVILLLIIPITFIEAMAYRTIVIEKLGVRAGLRKAVNMIRTHAGSALVLSVICVILGAVVLFVLGLILSPLLIALLNPIVTSIAECNGQGNNFDALASCVQQTGTHPRVILPLVTSAVIFAIPASIWTTFQSTLFTLAYRRWAK
jgi:hypothetical protein